MLEVGEISNFFSTEPTAREATSAFLFRIAELFAIFLVPYWIWMWLFYYSPEWVRKITKFGAILPFLAILALSRKLTGMARNAAVIVAWLASAVAFGLIHLPTYDWNLIQCLVVIGSARLVLTWAYIWSKNIWVSTGAHIINDWTIIALTTFLAPLATPI